MSENGQEPDRRGRRASAAAAFVLLALAGLGPAALGMAQIPPPSPGTASVPPLKVFLDWPGSDLEAIGAELPFAALVPSREDAQVEVRVMAAEEPGSLRLEFTGLKEFAGNNNVLTYRPVPGEPVEQTRKEMGRLIRIGLVRYIAKTPSAKHVSIAFADQVKPTSVVDPWHFWVFNLGIDQFMTGEQQYANGSWAGSFSANRVTPQIKIRSSFSGNLNRQRFDIEGETIRSSSHGYGFEGLVVKSLDGHWSVGAFLSVSSSTFSNIAFSVVPMPAVEYDLFPYEQSTRRQLRFLYKVGYAYGAFRELTVYDKLRQGLFTESLSATLEIKRPWGTVEAGLEGSHYFFKPFKYKVSLNAEVSFRIWKGLSFEVFGGYAKIHDQIYLPKAGATPEEILLMLRELETDYSYSLAVGLSFRFGSLQSTVVNPRFGSGGRTVSVAF